MTLSVIFFVLVGAVCLAAAAGVVLSRQPVYSALFMLVNFATLAVLYITLDAQFLAAAQIIIYAGGIVILILFVIILIGHETDDFKAGHRVWSRYVGLGLGLVMLGSLVFSVVKSFAEKATPTPWRSKAASPKWWAWPSSPSTCCPLNSSPSCSWSPSSAPWSWPASRD